MHRFGDEHFLTVTQCVPKFMISSVLEGAWMMMDYFSSMKMVGVS